MWGVKEQLIKVNGVELSVMEAGLNHADSMIMVHGLGFSKESMLPLFEHYRHTYHVVSYDTRGSGRSDKPDAWTLDDDAADLAGVAKALGLEHPVGIGFSMGSFIVMRAAEDYPDLFSKIVLIGTSGKDPASYREHDQAQGQAPAQAQPQTSQQKADAVNAKAAEQLPTNEQLMKKIKGSTEKPTGLVEELVDAVKVAEKMIKGHEMHPLQAAELIERTRPTTEVTAEQFEALEHSFAGFDNMKNAYKITVPVLCLTGDHDHANPPERGRAVAQAVKDGRFYAIPRSGHIAIYENLPDVLKHINEFLKND